MRPGLGAIIWRHEHSAPRGRPGPETSSSAKLAPALSRNAGHNGQDGIFLYLPQILDTSKSVASGSIVLLSRRLALWYNGFTPSIHNGASQRPVPDDKHRQTMKYDLLLKRGTLVDPAQAIHAAMDVAFANGRVAALGSGLPASDSAEVLDCTGHIVTPGMIDLHVHVFWGVSHLGIEVDSNCVAKGVTTAVDAGSAGADTFPGFRKYVIDVCATRLFAQLNISAQGMLNPDVGELDDLRFASVPRAVAMIEQHRDVILGVKVRLTRESIVSEDAGLRPLYLAREAADAVGLPIMVHPQAAWCDSIDDILAVMRKDDILTHCYHDAACGILDAQGRVRDSVLDAIERGVILDVGHGAGSFSWQIAEQALAQGVLPQTISSDLHHYNVNGPVYDLATTVSKFLHLGLSLDEALRRVTATPAQAIHLADEIGTLKIGAWGDAVVFKLESGRFPLIDSRRQERTASQRLTPQIVVRAGKVYEPAQLD
ncbi:MAG: amidohydrolase/deacetylase family metallohydrolase [Chloroflexi bacterium]|nr:MAG: amidohydrolase/deacetylase family metallohydrolase [Chloroflexota bacterium]